MSSPRKDGSPAGDQARNFEAVKLLAEGATLKDLAARYKVSYTRARQIVEVGRRLLSKNLA